MKNKIANGSLLVLFSALMYGSYGLWARLIGNSMGNFFQAWSRALIIVILLLPIAFFRHEITKIKKQDRKWFLVFLFFTSLIPAPIFYAFNEMDIGSASLLFFVAMFLTINIVGLVFLKEKLGVLKIFSSFLALLGLFVIFSFEVSKTSIFAIMMAILSGIASGGEVGFSKKLSGNYSPLYLTFLSWLIVFLVNGIISVAIGETQVVPAWNTIWLWQFFYALASLLAFWLSIAGFKRVETNLGSLIGLLEIVFSILFGLLVFKQQLTLSIICGGILIVLAATMSSFFELFKKVGKNKLNL